MGNAYISSFCMELYLITQAGITAGEGFLLLAEDEKDKDIKNILMDLYEKVNEGEGLSAAFRESGAFPVYMINMIEIGERTGYLESVYKALSIYYDRQVNISQTVRSAIVYPALLFIMMLTVIVVLVVSVLPIFSEVFAQLGATLSPMAQGFLQFGLWLRQSRYVLAGLLIALGILALLVWFLPSANKWFAKVRARIAGKTKLGQKIGMAHFAFAMAMTFASGLDPDSSFEMAQRLCEGATVGDKVKKCRSLVEQGASFSDAISAAELFEPLYCKMISIGMKTGAMDTVMDEIARRSEESVNIGIEKTIGKVEPTLVVIMSILVGIVLLSVMLPLVGIMSSIG